MSLRDRIVIAIVAGLVSAVLLPVVLFLGLTAIIVILGTPIAQYDSTIGTLVALSCITGPLVAGGIFLLLSVRRWSARPTGAKVVFVPLVFTAAGCMILSLVAVANGFHSGASRVAVAEPASSSDLMLTRTAPAGRTTYPLPSVSPEPTATPSPSNTAPATATTLPSLTPTITVTATSTLTPTPTNTATRTKVPTKTPPPSRTPVPAVSIYTIYSNFGRMTQLQFQDYVQSIAGKPVREVVQVGNVSDAGQVTLSGPWDPWLFNVSSFCVVVSGVPRQVGLTLSGGAQIYLRATVNGVVGNYDYYFNCENTLVLYYVGIGE